jgi:hypothetical protein
MGCTNSEITLSKTVEGDWDFTGDARLLLDVSPVQSSYTFSSNPLKIFYTALGDYDITLGGTLTLANFITIFNDRSLPTINAPDVVCLLDQNTVDISTPLVSGNSYEWKIYREGTLTGSFLFLFFLIF